MVTLNPLSKPWPPISSLFYSNCNYNNNDNNNNNHRNFNLHCFSSSKHIDVFSSLYAPTHKSNLSYKTSLMPNHSSKSTGKISSLICFNIHLLNVSALLLMCV